MAGPVVKTAGGWDARFDALAAGRPDLVLIAPLMLYILLLGLVPMVPREWVPWVIALRGVLPLVLVWRLRAFLPPWGRPHWPIAIVGGAVLAWGWVAGQTLFDDLGLGGRLPLMPGEKEIVDPRLVLGADKFFNTTWALRLLVAVITVPVVEEIFWRGFLLRALVDWNGFEKIPFGKFTWFSFLGTALLSTLQHPDNWAVSILCWMAFNLFFYWTRSLLCLVLMHGMTNLVLYFIVARVGDWGHW